MKKLLPLLLMMLVLIGVVVTVVFWRIAERDNSSASEALQATTDQENMDGNLTAQAMTGLEIQAQRQQEYPGSELQIVRQLSAGNGFNRYIASYESEGNTIYGLLAVPTGTRPEGGWPAIIFNHGYIPPQEYISTEKYVAYIAALAREGYVVFMSDYRGHGESEGEAVGGYGSPGYTTDVLNAWSTLSRYSEVNADRMGMWGHSMGGYITLRSMVINSDIKAGVIWAGVVASYPDLLNNWRRRNATPPPLPSGARRWRQMLTETFGTPEQNPTFWNSISANSYLADVSGPIQLHHATGDTSVPVEFSEKLAAQLDAAGKENEIYIYQGDNHNISGNFGIAMERTVEYFDRYLKN